jgi:hypothetical protein
MTQGIFIGRRPPWWRRLMWRLMPWRRPDLRTKNLMVVGDGVNHIFIGKRIDRDGSS